MGAHTGLRLWPPHGAVPMISAGCQGGRDNPAGAGTPPLWHTGRVPGRQAAYLSLPHGDHALCQDMRDGLCRSSHLGRIWHRTPALIALDVVLVGAKGDRNM